jgi:type IV pilus assembly protein PilA
MDTRAGASALDSGPMEPSDKPRSSRAKATALVVSGIGVAIILSIGGVVAISAPKFMRFQDRSRQSEGKVRLKAIVTSERALYGEYDRYSPKPTELGLALEKGNRYHCRLGPGPASEETLPADPALTSGLAPERFDEAIPGAVREKLGVQGTCPACELTAVCVGNIDSDQTMDVWSVTLGYRQEGQAFTSVAGEFIHHQDDAAK